MKTLDNSIPNAIMQPSPIFEQVCYFWETVISECKIREGYIIAATFNSILYLMFYWSEKFSQVGMHEQLQN